MNGIAISEVGHVVNILPPSDITSGTTSALVELFSMKNWAHATVIVQFGTTAAAATALTINECEDAAATGPHALPCHIQACGVAFNAANGDVIAAMALDADGIIASPGGTDNTFYVIEIDSTMLRASHPWIQVLITAPANAILCSAVAILTGGRYEGAASVTVLA
jgi:hypothetical protein